jgi:D-alanyl-D-alanine dipeptidase
MEGYVAKPDDKRCGGSVHSYAAAVDATVADADGHELDMGTAYDYFGSLAGPRHEERFLLAGKLTHAQVAARHLLRDAMVQGGHFFSIPNEWWHFDASRGGKLCARYSRLDVPLTIVVP